MTDIYNFPRIPVTRKTLRYPVLFLAIASILCVLGFSFTISIAISGIVCFLIVAIETCSRITRFKKYIKNIGHEVEPRDDQNFSIHGAVAFEGKPIMLTSIPLDAGIEINRQNVHRLIHWDDVTEVERVTFLKKPFLRLKLINQKTVDTFVVPWCERADEYIPNRLNS